MQTRTTATLTAFAVTAACLVLLVAGGLLPVLKGDRFLDLTDPDSYFRLLKVEHILAGHAWFDGRVAALFPPEGLSIHWGLPVDLLLMAAALPLRPFADWHGALYVATLYTMPALLAASALLVWAMGEELAGRSPSPGESAVRAAFAVLLVLPLARIFSPGDADHHAPLLALFAAVLAGGLGNRPRLLAALAVLAVWTSTEGAVVAAAALGWLGLNWATGRLAVRELGGAAVLTVALGSVALALERGPLLAVTEVDRWSWVHLAALALANAALAACAMLAPPRLGVRARLLVLLAVALVLGAAGAGGFLLWGGSAYGEVGPFTQRYLLDALVLEHGLRFGSAAAARNAALSLAPSVLAVAIALVRRRGLDARHWALLGLAVGLAGAAFVNHRFAFYATLAAAPVVLAAQASWPRPAALALAAFGPALTLATLWNAPPKWGACDFREVAPALAELTRDGGMIAYPSVFRGPEITYKTGAPTMTGPYHRNEASIRALVEGFYLPAAAGAASLRAHGVTGILFCDGELSPEAGRRNPGTLMGHLLTRGPLPGMERVNLPDDLERAYTLFRVER